MGLNRTKLTLLQHDEFGSNTRKGGYPLNLHELKLEIWREDSANPLGTDIIIESMLSHEEPVTLEWYLELAFNPLKVEELGGEHIPSIPRILCDPRLKELDPSETYYEEIFRVIADNPKLSTEKARKLVEAYA